MINIMKKTMVILAISQLTACVMAPEPKPNDPHYAPVIPSVNPQVQSNNGSIYQAGQGLGLFTDQRAHRVGDIITVNLQERTSSSKSSSVSTAKDSEVKFEDDTNLGTVLLGKDIGGMGLGSLLDVGQTRAFDGSADADQSNSLNGSITVTVSDLMPNGNLVVRGEKWITLNRGDEFIRISGIIRPQDVSPENTVESFKMANARITYSETGELASTQKQGFLSRFFHSVYWPF
ncbi:MAG: flagellar basal body L-ring protein FlgH [Cellvibrionaceae bacterium]